MITMPPRSISRSISRRVFLVGFLGCGGLLAAMMIGLLLTLTQVEGNLAAARQEAANASDPFLQNITLDLVSTSQGLASNADIPTALLWLRNHNSSFLDIIFILPDGTIQAQQNAAGRPARTSIDEPGWLQSPLSLNKVRYGSVHMDGGHAYLEMAVTATNSNGQPSGLLVARIDLARLSSSMDAVQFGESGYAYLVDASGQLVTSRDLHLVKTGSTIQKLVGRTPQQIVAARVDFYQSANHQFVLAQAQPLAAVPWFAIVEQPASSVFIPLGTGLLALLLALAGLLFLLFDIFSFTQRRIVAPLINLRTVFEQVETGHLESAPFFDCQDEIGDVGKAFNQLTDRLKSQTETLREGALRYQALSEDSLVGVYVIQNHILTYVNSALAHLFGYDPAELTGQSPDLVIFEPDRAMVAANIQARLTGATPSLQYKFRGLCKDGSIRYVEVMGTRIELNDQAVIIGNLLDITERMQTEQALRASEERNRQVAEMTTDYFFIVNVSSDQKMTLVWASTNMERITGRQIQDAHGLDEWVTIIHPEDMRAFLEFIQRILSSASAGNLTCRSRAQTGVQRWIEITAQPKTDDSGKVVALIGAVKDVSDRMLAERALRDSEEKFSRAFENAPIIICLSDAETGRFKEVNAETLRITGFRREEMINNTSIEIGFISPEERGRLVKAFKENGRVNGINLTIHAKDQRPIETLYSGELVTIAGKTQLLSLMQDITGQKQAQDALRRSEARFRAVVENSHEGFLFCDLSAIITYRSLSNNMIDGFSNSERLGQSLFSLVHPDDTALVNLFWEQVKQNPEGVHQAEYRIRHKDGMWRWVETTAQNLWENPQVREIVVTRREITDRKRTENLIHMRLELLDYANAHPYTGVLEKAVAQSEELTFSLFGFFHTLDGGQKKPALQSRSTRTLRQFSEVSRQAALHFIEHSGIWDECVRTEKPVVINDTSAYSDENYAQGIGVIRLLAIPIRRDGKVVAILGLGNKPGAYTETDVELAEYIAGIAWEIGAKKRADEQNQILKYSIDIAPDGAYWMDKEGRFLYVNESGCKSLGYTPEEMRQITISDINPNATPERWEQVWQALRSGKGSSILSVHRRKDGSEFPVELTSMYGKFGEQEYINGFAKDITERIKAEKALRESEERRTLFMNSASDSFYLLDANLNFIDVNSQALQFLEKKVEEVIGKNMAEIVPDSTSSGRYHHLLEVIRTGRPYVVEDIIPHPLYGERHFVLNAFKVGEGLGVISHDITDRKQHERELEVVVQISAALRIAQTRMEMLPIITSQVFTLVRAASAALLFYDFSTNDYKIEYAEGTWGSTAGQHIPATSAIIARVLADNRPYLTNDLPNDPNFFYHDNVGDLRTFIEIPLINKDTTIGFLAVGSRNPFSDLDLRVLETIANIAANAIHRAALFEQQENFTDDLKRAYDTTLDGWAHALELRDQETEGHTRRVVKRTLELAQAIHIDTSHLENLRRGALLHDIGKMGIPDSVLLKPGTLNEREWEIMQRHPEYAYRLLSPIDYLKPALDIPYCHHEKWDGSGYPRGLRGEEIPLGARIFAVVDVWDALTSDRPYRPAWSQPKAHEYIRTQSGRHFDPQIVTAFFQLHNAEEPIHE